MNANFWLIVLVVVTCFDIFLHFRRARFLDDKISGVLNILIVWAETWGESPDVVKPKLHEALTAKPYSGPRKT